MINIKQHLIIVNKIAPPFHYGAPNDGNSPQHQQTLPPTP